MPSRETAMHAWWRWTWRASLPMAAGHLASVALVAAGAAVGAAIRREAMIAGAAALLLVLVATRLLRRRTTGPAAEAAHAGLALWSFSMATVQGAGLVLVPAPVPPRGALARGLSSRARWRRAPPP